MKTENLMTEVALVEWGERGRANTVRLLGRSKDPNMVEAVRQQLVRELQDPDHLDEGTQLRLVRRADDGDHDSDVKGIDHE